jgi:hypothetical protein
MNKFSDSNFRTIISSYSEIIYINANNVRLLRHLNRDLETFLHITSSYIIVQRFTQSASKDDCSDKFHCKHIVQQKYHDEMDFYVTD